MTTISLKDDYFNLECSLKEDGPKAVDVLRAFTGLMLTQTYGISSIRKALQEVLEDIDEGINVYNAHKND